MPVNKLFRSWVEYSVKLLYGNDGSVAVPNKSNFYGLICNGNITDTSSKAAVIASEIISDSYARFNAVIGSESTYDADNKQHKMPAINWNAQFDESIQFNCAVILSGAKNLANQPVSATPGTPTIFTTTDPHELAQGEEIVITADTSGALPSGLDSSVIYYVSNIISSTQFRVCTNPVQSSEVALTSSGTNLRLRYAKGRLVGFRIEDAVETVLANQPVSWSFSLTGAAYSGVGE